MSESIKYPPNIAKLFTPRPPLPYLPPQDVSPENRRTHDISAIAPHLALLNEYKKVPYTPTTTKQQEQQKAKKERLKQKQIVFEEIKAKWDPFSDPQVKTDPYRTVFVSRLDYSIGEIEMQKKFATYGVIKSIRVVRDKDGKSRGYGFVEFERERDAVNCVESFGNSERAKYDRTKEKDEWCVNGRYALIDFERSRMKGWIPRMLGGGLGGRGYSKSRLLNIRSNYGSNIGSNSLSSSSYNHSSRYSREYHGDSHSKDSYQRSTYSRDKDRDNYKYKDKYEYKSIKSDNRDIKTHIRDKHDKYEKYSYGFKYNSPSMSSAQSTGDKERERESLKDRYASYLSPALTSKTDKRVERSTNYEKSGSTSRDSRDFRDRERSEKERERELEREKNRLRRIDEERRKNGPCIVLKSH